LQIPVAIATDLLVTQRMPVPSPHPTPEEMAEFFRTQMRFLLTFMPILLLITLIVTPIMHAALVHAAARIYLGKPAGVRRAFRAGFGRAIPLIWTWMLIFFFTFGGFFLCILPGILVTFWFALASTIAVLEGISGMAALQRSWYLMRTAWVEHYLTYFLLGILVGAINVGIGAGSAFILERHVAGMVGALLQSLTGAFTCIAVVVFYFSCRCRVENFDLVQLAKEVAAAPIGPLETQEQG
jgi:hypothetical protein